MNVMFVENCLQNMPAWLYTAEFTAVKNRTNVTYATKHIEMLPVLTATLEAIGNVAPARKTVFHVANARNIFRLHAACVTI